jgi:hypothetical protein
MYFNVWWCSLFLRTYCTSSLHGVCRGFSHWMKCRSYDLFVPVSIEIMNIQFHEDFCLELIEALCYKPEGRRFNFQWCHWNFSLSWSFWPHYGSGVNSAFNRNVYEEYFLGGKGSRCMWLTTLPPSCADCLEIWEPQPPGTLWACPGL